MRVPRQLRLDAAIERLFTPSGEKVLDRLYGEVAPHVAPGQHEGEFTADVPSPPADAFHRAVVQGIHNAWSNGLQAKLELPTSLYQVFEPFTNAGGVIDRGQVIRVLGARGARFLEQLDRIDDAPTDPVAARRIFRTLEDESRTALVGTGLPSAPRLEALDLVRERLARPDEFAGFQVMGLQHLFASTASLFDGLVKSGVEWSDVHITGKVYSSNHRVAAELVAQGADVADHSLGETPEGFAVDQHNAIRHQLGQMTAGLKAVRDGERVEPSRLLIDDGAEAIKLLHEQYPQYAPHFVCVEQTRRGARIVHELADKGELRCPVANVAESWAKLEFESPMIGHSVVTEVTRKLDGLIRQGVPVRKEALVMGYGSVGKAVADALLAQGFEVHVYDQDPTRLAELPEGMVGHADKKGALSHAGVLVSCVGSRTLFEPDMESLPDGAILVNAASANDELGPQISYTSRPEKGGVADEDGDRWGVFQGKPIYLGHGLAPAHHDQIVDWEGKQLLFVNRGYVINMTGELDPIPPSYIQLTRSLLFLGAVTARRADGPGIHALPDDWQRMLVHTVDRGIGGSGSLKQPRWNVPKPHEPGPPPASIVEAAERARAGLPPPKAQAYMVPAKVRRRLDAQQAEERQALERVQGSRDPQRMVYGLELGRPRPGSREATIASVIGSKHELTVDGAALYKATADFNAALGAHFVASLRPGSPVFQDPFTVEFNEGRAFEGEPPSTQARFEIMYGRSLTLLAAAYLAKRIRREPTPEQVAGLVKEVARKGKVDIGPYVAALDRTQAPGDEALVVALRG